LSLSRYIESKDLPADIFEGKSGKLDVLGRLDNGAKVNVEVQIKNHFNIAKRSLFYWSKKYTWNMKSGDDYSGLVPVIAVNIIDFPLFNIEDFHTSFHLWEDGNKDIMLSDVCEIHFLDMVKFRKTGYNLNDRLHRWLVYFDERSPAELIEEVVKMDSAIHLAQEKLELISRDPDLLRAYEQYEKAASDWTSNMNAARTEGLAEGEKKGESEAKLTVARKLKELGYDQNIISNATGLDSETVNNL
jgi:predicted transposase/invertase (TIGR01784 family)